MNVSDAIANRNAGVTGYKTMYNPNPTLKQAELDMPELSGYGKWFEKKGYAKGGMVDGKPEKPKAPIYVTDPNDPRLKAYNDSLSLYIKSEITKDALKRRGNFKEDFYNNAKSQLENDYNTKLTDKIGDKYVVFNKNSERFKKIHPSISPIMIQQFEREPPLFPDEYSSLLDSGSKSRMANLIYKKPEKPVVLKKEDVQTKTPIVTKENTETKKPNVSKKEDIIVKPKYVKKEEIKADYLPPKKAVIQQDEELRPSKEQPLMKIPEYKTEIVTTPYQHIKRFKDSTGKVVKEEYYDFNWNRIDTDGYAKGGEIKGKGTAKSDSIKAKVEKGAFIVPAENAEKAKAIKEELLESPADEKAELEHKNGVSVKLSDGEYMFTKEEAEELKNMGIDLYKEFAPNSDDLKGLKDGGLTSEKAKIILREGVANGKSLTPAQTRFMGWVAGGRKAKGGIVGYKEGGEVKEYANGGESTSGNEPDLGNNKFESIRKQAEDDLKKKYPNKKVEVVYKGDYRSFDDQNKSFKSGASTTKSSLHQVGGARDFNIIIDGRVLGNSPSDLKIYKDYVWKAAENNGAYHLKEDGFGSTDPYHISLVEEKGDGTAFKRLIENYPALADTDNFKQAIKFAEEQKSKNPKDTTYDGLLAAKEFVASKAAQTNDDFDASFAANVQKANTNLVKVNNSTTDVKTKSTTNTQSSGNKSFDKTINDLLKKDYKEVSDVDKSIAQLNELQAKNKAMGLPYNTSIQNAVQQLNIIKPKIERAATHAKVMGEKTDDIETMAANLKKIGASDSEINAFKTASYKNPYDSF